MGTELSKQEPKQLYRPNSAELEDGEVDEFLASIPLPSVIEPTCPTPPTLTVGIEEGEPTAKVGKHIVKHAAGFPEEQTQEQTPECFSNPGLNHRRPRQLCSYCDKPGHTVWDCQYVTEDGRWKCPHCGQFDHAKGECPKPCPKCHSSGHGRDSCPLSPDSGLHPTRVLQINSTSKAIDGNCLVCGQSGHLADGCPAPCLNCFGGKDGEWHPFHRTVDCRQSCFFCRQAGHGKLNCPLLCVYCHQPGHPTEMCFELWDARKSGNASVIGLLQRREKHPTQFREVAAEQTYLHQDKSKVATILQEKVEVERPPVDRTALPRSDGQAKESSDDGSAITEVGDLFLTFKQLHDAEKRIRVLEEQAVEREESNKKQLLDMGEKIGRAYQARQIAETQSYLRLKLIQDRALRDIENETRAAREQAERKCKQRFESEYKKKTQAFLNKYSLKVQQYKLQDEAAKLGAFTASSPKALPKIVAPQLNVTPPLKAAVDDKERAYRANIRANQAEQRAAKAEKRGRGLEVELQQLKCKRQKLSHVAPVCKLNHVVPAAMREPVVKVEPVD